MNHNKNDEKYKKKYFKYKSKYLNYKKFMNILKGGSDINTRKIKGIKKFIGCYSILYILL